MAGRPDAARARRAWWTPATGPTARCGSPTSGRCSATTSRAGPPARTSAPAASPSARWCRCARCRTGWCACSASTTASSRGTALVDGDDVLARDPVTGERDIRSEDRQLLLDAIGAATERLVVTYTGADPHTGQDRPPAVPLGELLDALDRTTEAPVRDAVVVPHPLQPYDVRNVEPGRLGTPTPVHLRPAVAGRRHRGDRTAPRRRRSSPRRSPPPRGPADVALADLVTFFSDPVKGFFRALDLTLPWDVDAVSDAMPVEIDQLETWGVGDRMLARHARGIHPDTARKIEWRRGALPPGQLGWRKATRGPRAGDEPRASPRSPTARSRREAYDVDVDLRGGRRLTGTVTPVYGDRLVAVGYSKLDGKHLLESWVRLLALAAGHPDHNWTALTIGRSPRGSQAAQRLLGPRRRAAGSSRPGRALRRGPARAAAAAAQDVVRLGLRPAPRPGPRREAAKKWKSGRYPGEDADPAHVRVWGEHAALDVLTARPAGAASRLVVPRSAPLLRSERGPCDAAQQQTQPFDLLGPLPTGRPPRCSRPAPAPARPTRSPRWSPATSPRATPASTTCCSSPSAGPPARSCASGSATSWSRRPRRSTTRRSADDDDLLRHLVTGADDELAERRLRLQDALAGFDAATIATTHQFCQLVLRSLGVAGDTDAGVTLVENLDELMAEVVDDLYLQRFGDVKARRAAPARRRSSSPTRWSATRGPADPVDPPAETRPRSGRASPTTCSRELERRKRLLGILGFDDLLSRLAVALEDRRRPGPGPDEPALVDRDGRRVPGHRPGAVGGHRARLRGPGDAGADRRPQAGHLRVPRRRRRHLPPGPRARRRAAHPRHQLPQRRPAGRPPPACSAARRWATRTSWCATSGPHHQSHRLAGAPANDPFRLRVVTRETSASAAPRTIRMDDLRAPRAATSPPTCALLASGATYDGRPVAGPRRRGDRREPPRRPGLPRRAGGRRGAGRLHRRHRCLRLAGGRGLAVPARGVRAAGPTGWCGRRRPRCSSAGAPPTRDRRALTDEVAETLRGWADHARARGIAAVLEAAYVAGMAARVLAWRGGERHLTDMEHLTQLLHEVAHREGLGLPALLQWLRTQREERAGAAERNRRLDSDARRSRS